MCYGTVPVFRASPVYPNHAVKLLGLEFSGLKQQQIFLPASLGQNLPQLHRHCLGLWQISIRVWSGLDKTKAVLGPWPCFVEPNSKTVDLILPTSLMTKARYAPCQAFNPVFSNAP